MNKLWSDRKDINQKIEKFTIGKDAELDIRIATYDMLGSMAHAIMLYESDLMNREDLSQILTELNKLLDQVENGEFIIEEGVEDVHSQVEFILTRNIGEPGKKLHTSRSRNDQVLVDLKLYYRDFLQVIGKKIETIVGLFLRKSERHQEVLMPGYTHMQVAMPSSFGLWFGAYGEALIHDFAVIKNTLEIINHNPLGSAAGYGTSFPIRRKRTTELLGFTDLEYNVIAASMNRGKTEYLIANAIAGIGLTLAKWSMDVCQYNSQNFGFISLPEEYTTGSSIMPHKKNPDVFELLRARFNSLTVLPHEISSVIQNLSTGYHRDYQLLKEILFPKMEILTDCLDIVEYVIEKIEVRDNLMSDPLYSQAFSVEMIKQRVDEGIPFREAYLQVKKQLESPGASIPEIHHSHEGSIGQLNTTEIRGKLDMVKARFTDFDFDSVYDSLRNFQV